MSDTKYIYEGKRIDVWEDEKYVTLALALTTIGIPKKSSSPPIVHLLTFIFF